MSFPLTCLTELVYITIYNMMMMMMMMMMISHEHHGVSKHQQLNCLFNGLLKLTTKKIPKIHITGCFVGESTISVDFTQKWSAIQNVSMPWCQINYTYSNGDIECPSLIQISSTSQAFCTWFMLSHIMQWLSTSQFYPHHSVLLHQCQWSNPKEHR